MRKASAIALFVVLAMPALAPLLLIRSPQPDSSLPPCCRRDGKHHCAMMAMLERESREPAFRQVPAVCPFRSANMTLAHTSVFFPPPAFAFYANVVRHPAIYTQTFANLLVSEARSHQKRGPPSLLS